MKKSICLLTVCVIAVAVLAGCAPKPPRPADNPFTAGEVSLTLKKGVTTKAEVARAFGAPNIVTQNNGRSTWIYQKDAQVSHSHVGGVFGTILLAGGSESSASSSQSSRTMTLEITFNKQNRVVDFKSMTTSF